jgi:general secretion pathway protein B
LEALKKAERQHRLGEVPGIGTAAMMEAPPRNRWLIILLLLGVAGGMLLLGIYLGRPGPEQTPATVQMAPSQPLLPEPLQPELRPQIQVESVESIEQPEPVATMETKQEKKVAPPAPEAQVESPVASEPVSIEPVAPPPEPPAAPKQMSELPDGFVSNLPKLNIDIHSFDERPARSYVLINMQKYREGEYLAEGPLLAEILRDGVILEYMGERFILPLGTY